MKKNTLASKYYILLLVMGLMITFSPLNPILSLPSSKISPVSSQTGEENTGEAWGFVPYWEDDELYLDPLTHVIWYGVEMNSVGELGNTHGILTSDLVGNTHNASAKCILTVYQYDPSYVSTFLSNQNYRNSSISNILDLLEASDADGVLIDYSHGFGSSYKSNLVSYLGELDAQLKANNSDYITVMMLPPVDWSGIYDVDQIQLQVDKVMINAFSYYPSDYEKAIHFSPLYGEDRHCVNWSVNEYKEWGIENRSDQFILALPLYGRDYPVEDTSFQANTTGTGSTITYGQCLWQIDQESISINYHIEWEAVYYNYQEDGTQHQVWFETLYYIERKCQYAINQNLGGVAFWCWGYHEMYSEFEDLVVKLFPKETDTPPVPCPTFWESASSWIIISSTGGIGIILGAGISLLIKRKK